MEGNENISARIPKNFVPEKYTISFSPDYAHLKYTIKAEILINSLSENFPYLILNASSTNYLIKYLLLYKFDNIADEWVQIGQKKEGTDILTHNYFFELPEKDIKYAIQDGIYIPIDKPVKKGEQLKLIFFLKGKISPELKKNALYICTNYDEKRLAFKDDESLLKEWKENDYNKINELSKEDLSQNIFFKNLVTVFFCTPAKFRLNMPCFDEPCYKAVYSFQLVIDKYFVDAFKQLKCVTNGSLIHVDLDKDTNKYIFSYSDSALMSSYLFTFVIGNYDLIETVNENKTKLRVFTPLRDHHDGALCMNLAQYSLRFYQKFFDINYYYDKLDFVPVPQMDYRAMENLGCIVFKNEAMLFSHFQSIFEKKFCSRTICHEISHMWFGDLVTMEWWDDIWLNEGFARIFEFLCLTEIEKKENKFWDNFIFYIYNEALIYDEASNTHPIVRKVETVEMMDKIFDTISYAKGSSVIKMLMHYIGIDNFRKSVSTYLKKYMYKNTNTKMLWECFDEITKLKVSELMNEWVNFAGHPLLTVDIIKKEEKYYFKLEQNSMLENDNTIWKLPVFIKSKNFEICRLIPSKDYEISFEELNLDYNEIEEGNNFVVFNNDLKGFYRVNYKNEILLNSILINYKNNQSKIVENENKVNDFDIFGILSYENYNKSLEGIKKIFNKIKPIENSTLLLRYAKQLYKDYKEEFYYKFFISLVDSDNNKLNSLVNKFYINEENKDMYKYQFNDEFDSLYLYFRVIIDDNEEIAKKVFIPNYLDYFEFLNKNYKYTLVEIMMKYLYLIEDIKDKENLLVIIAKDYTDNYYYSSYYVNLDYKTAILNYNCINEELYHLLNVILIANKRNIFLAPVKLYLQGKNNLRKMLDYSIEQIKQNFITYNKVNTNKNICTFFESKENPYYIYLKQFFFQINKNEALVEDIFYNYFKDKFNVESDEDCAQLISVVQDFVQT